MGKSSDELLWRDTYFIWFPQERRPLLDKVTAALEVADARLQLENCAADDDGLLQSLWVELPEIHSVVEISYKVGDSVIEEALEWAKQLQAELPSDELQKMIKADARLEVAHFERVAAGKQESSSAASSMGDETGGEFGADEDVFDMLDPTCLLTVVDALAELTGGLTLDPASGQILS